MNVLLHDQTQAQLQAIGGARSGSYIFHGARSVGKATAALELARALNCRGDEAGQCAPCRQFVAGNYPDFVVVKPEDKPSITIEQIRALIQSLALSPYYASGRRIVVIDAAEQMTPESQNALLKVIEEPPPQTLFVLVTERLSALLPTVRSRCAHIHFPRLSGAQIAALLVNTRGIASATAAGLAAAATGAPGTAIELAAHPEAATARLELARAAAGLPALNRFGRLLLAARLVSEGASLPTFATLLHHQIIQGLRSGEAGPASTSSALDALEHFRLRLQAKVSARVALESLMLEL